MTPTCTAAFNLESSHAIVEYHSPPTDGREPGQKQQLLVRNPRLSFELLPRFDVGSPTTGYELTNCGYFHCDDLLGPQLRVREFMRQFGDVTKPGHLTLKVKTAIGEELWPVGYGVLTSFRSLVDFGDVSVSADLLMAFNARSDYVLVSKEVSGQREWTVLRAGELRARRYRMAILAALTQALGDGKELAMFYSPDDGRPTYDVNGASLEAMLVNAVWSQTQRLNRPWSETVQEVRAMIQDLTAKLDQAEDALRNAKQPPYVV